MDDTHSHFSLYGKPPLIQLFASLFIIMIAGMLLFGGLLLAGNLIFRGDFGNLLKNIPDGISEKEILFLRYIVISQDISIFIIPAIIIMSLLKPLNNERLIDLRAPRINEIVLVVLLAFCIFPITSFTGELNSGMHFPDWLSGLENWMNEKENDATQITDLVMKSDTFWVMVFNIFVIAALPALGEELIFRGVFQKIFYTLFKSGHIAIWVTAFLFSALHFQFFGFIPRFILGLVFGYLFYWSGSLWLPVVSHFVNNAVPVAGAYIIGWDKFNVSSDIPLPRKIIGLVFPILISTLILIYFRKRGTRKSRINNL
jgi:uncharacterized protein